MSKGVVERSRPELWPIGVAARRLEILNRRCRTLLTWLWPCGRKVTSLPRGASVHMVVAM